MLFCVIFSADDFSGEYMRSLALVDYTGRVFWPPPTKFRSTCPVNVAFFPFDDQTCILKLASWLHDGHSVRKYIFLPQIHINVVHLDRTSSGVEILKKLSDIKILDSRMKMSLSKERNSLKSVA